MNRVQLKQQAKGLISETKPSPLIVGIIFVVIMAVTGIISSSLVGVTVDQDTIMRYFGTGNFDGFADYVSERMPSSTAFLLNTALDIVTIIISAGFTIFALNVVRGIAASYWNLFDGFAQFIRIIWLYILEGIFISLWSLLLIVPGVIAMYRYRQAIYVLLEHPEMSALDCIRESKAMMTGHKAELFVLDLSFILWAFAYSIPYLGYVVGIYYLPYRELTLALYYKSLCDLKQQASWTPEF